MESQHYWAYGLLAILNVALGALNQQLGAGVVPIPSDWAWLVPIVSAVIVALTMLLPRVSDAPKS